VENLKAVLGLANITSERDRNRADSLKQEEPKPKNGQNILQFLRKKGFNN
jgi:hypothetical protein